MDLSSFRPSANVGTGDEDALLRFILMSNAYMPDADREHQKRSSLTKADRDLYWKLQNDRRPFTGMDSDVLSVGRQFPQGPGPAEVKPQSFAGEDADLPAGAVTRSRQDSQELSEILKRFNASGSGLASNMFAQQNEGAVFEGLMGKLLRGEATPEEEYGPLWVALNQAGGTGR